MRALAATALLLVVAGSALGVAAPPTVELLDYRFAPSEARTWPGATLRLVNRGLEPHTYTSADAAFPFEADVGIGETTTLALPNATRTIHVYCRYHASPAATAAEGAMAGDLVLDVAAREEAPPAPAATPLPVALAVGALALGAVRRRA